MSIEIQIGGGPMFSAKILLAAAFAITSVQAWAAEPNNANDKQNDSKSQVSPLEGTWLYVSIQYQGRPYPFNAGDYITFSDGTETVKRSGKLRQYKIRFDVSKSPKQFESPVFGTPGRLRSIYATDGDKLIICENHVSRIGAKAPNPSSTVTAGSRFFRLFLD
jgi:uncharacterized protein (TIGR03067 family)